MPTPSTGLGPTTRCVVRLWLLFPLAYPQRRQAVVCFPTVEACFLNPPQAPARGATHVRRTPRPQPPPQHPRNQLLELRRCQCRGPFFSPAGFPGSGTTSPSAPAPGGDTIPARSVLRSPPAPPPLWLAASTPRPGAGP